MGAFNSHWHKHPPHPPFSAPRTWSGDAYLRSRLLNWFVVHRPQRLKSSHLDIISKCILFLFYALVLILSIYLFLSMFILVFYQFIDFLLFYCLGASLCCLFPVLEPFMTESIYFQSLQHALIKSIGYSQSIPAALLTGPSFTTCSWAQSLLALPAGTVKRTFAIHPCSSADRA